MPISVNPDTGEVLELKDNKWVPARVAENDETGERLVFNNGQWEPLQFEKEQPQIEKGEQQPFTPQQPDAPGFIQGLVGDVPPQPTVKGMPETPRELAEGLAFTGATVGSILAPQMAVPAAAAKLGPLITGPKFGLLTNLPKIFGAGVGGGLGEAVGEATTEPDASLTDVGVAGAKGFGKFAAFEAGGLGAAKILGKVLKPVAGKMSDAGKALIEFTKREKLPLAPSAALPGTFNRVMEGGSELFAPGKLVNQHFRKKMAIGINRLINEVPESVGQIRGAEESANIARQAFTELVEGTERQAKTLANNFLSSVPEGGIAAQVPIKTFKPLLNNIKVQAKSRALKNFVETELEQIGKGVTKNATDLETSMRQLGGINIRGVDRKFITQLRNAIKQDFGNAGADMQLLDDANRFFQKSRGLTASRVAKQIKINPDRPGGIPNTKLTVRVFNSGNEGLVKSLRENLPKDVYDDFAAQNLANMFDNFTVPSEKLPMVRILSPRWAKAYKDIRPVFEAGYDPQTIQALDNLAAFVEKTSADVAKFEKFSVGELAKLTELNVGAGIGAHFAGGSGLVIVPAGVSPFMARSLMAPNGLMKKWLTTGLLQSAVPVAQEGVRLGARAIAADEQ